MDKNTLIILLFFTVMFGAGIGFYVAKAIFS